MEPPLYAGYYAKEASDPIRKDGPNPCPNYDV
jgi:hypothetical protein